MKDRIFFYIFFILIFYSDRFRVISLIIADDDQLKRFDVADPSKLINDIVFNI